MASGCIVIGMKISEIRNKMFNLSDLKGLINENSVSENMDWRKFFDAHPKFLGPEYDFKNGDDLLRCKEVLDAMAEADPKYLFLKDENTVAALLASRDRPTYEKKKNLLGGILKNGYAKGFGGNRLLYIQGLQRKEVEKTAQSIGTDSVVPNNVQTVGGVEIIRKKNEIEAEENTKKLSSFFENNGGTSLQYSDILETNFELAKNYVDSCFELANLAAETFVQEGCPVKVFDDTGLIVGAINNSYTLFLFFYYCIHCEKRRKGIKNKRLDYAANMKPGLVSQYAKYVCNTAGKERYGRNWNRLSMADLFTLMYFCPKTVACGCGTGENEGKNIPSEIKSLNLDGPELTYARSTAYAERYRMVTIFAISDNDITKIANLFSFPKEGLFDPLENISETQIMMGIQRCYAQGDTVINTLLKPVMTLDEKAQSPAEQIFSTAKSVKNVIDLNFEKILGTSGRNVLGGKEGIQLLLGPAKDGIDKLREDAEGRGYGGERIPRPVKDLTAIYDAEIIKMERGAPEDKKTTVQKESLLMWKLLQRENDTKTQDEIFNYLLGISDEDTSWQQEYNRYDIQDSEQGEGGLGRKSIDILGKKTDKSGFEKKLCFEYQGEQHYHPVNVRPSDYQYGLFSAMRDEILVRCGFKTDETGVRKYYYGRESVKDDEVRFIIIEVFKKYANELKKALETSPKSLRTSPIANHKGFNPSVTTSLSEGSSVKSINIKGLKTINFEEVVEYFEEIIETIETAKMNREDPNALDRTIETVFENPPLQGIVPYLCSPCRFFDEVQYAMDAERDVVKSKIIARRTGPAGWTMAYVTPKVKTGQSSTFTQDDFDYTVKLAGSDSVVFQWSNEGKLAIAKYLENMGFRTPISSKSSTEPKQLQENKTSLFQQIIIEVINGGVL